MAMPTLLETLTRRVWRSRPTADMRPYVRAYIAQAIEVPQDKTARLTIAATVYPVLVVTYAGHVQTTLHLKGAPIPQIALTGPVPGAFRTTLAGRLRGFFVQLEPSAPLALFGVEGTAWGHDLSFRQLVHPDVAPLLEAWGREIGGAGEEGASFGERIARTEQLLVDCLALDGLAPSRDRAAHAARRTAPVFETDGTQRVRHLADELAMGASTLRRRFRRDLGISPKAFSAIVRFRHALAYLHAHPGASWAGVAARFGYADQSHLIRDYRRFAGVVPSRWDDAERFVDLTFGILQDGADG